MTSEEFKQLRRSVAEGDTDIMVLWGHYQELFIDHEHTLGQIHRLQKLEKHWRSCHHRLLDSLPSDIRAQHLKPISLEDAMDVACHKLNSTKE